MSSSAEVSLYEFTRHHPLRLPSVAVNHSPTPAFPARLPGEEREDAGGEGSRGFQGHVPAPSPSTQHSSRLWQDGVDEEDVVFGKAGVPDTKCLVNSDVS